MGRYIPPHLPARCSSRRDDHLLSVIVGYMVVFPDYKIELLFKFLIHFDYSFVFGISWLHPLSWLSGRRLLEHRLVGFRYVTEMLSFEY